MSLFYVEYGDLSAVDGVVVLLHGFLGTHEMCASRLAAPLCAGDCEYADGGESFGRRVVAVDLPFHGRSSEVDADDLLDAARELHATLRSCRVRTCGVVGYSLGGRMALALAKLGAQDNFVAAIVLISANPGLEDGGGEERALRLARDRQHAADIVDDFDAFLRRWYAAPMWGESLRESEREQWVGRVQTTNTARAMARAVENLSVATMPSLWSEVLGDHAVPMAMVCGAEDVKYAAIGNRVSRRHPVVTAARCGHQVLLQNPTLVHRVVEASLQVPLLFCRTKLTSMRVRRFELPLRRAMSVAGRADVARREGVLVRLTDGVVVGVGESSPLPGFHAESVDRMQAELERVAGRIHVAGGDVSLWDVWREPLSPAARFGIEMAGVSLIARRYGLSLRRTLRNLAGDLDQDGPGRPRCAPSATAAARVAINAVVPRVDGDLVALATDLIERGYSVLKVKVGAASSTVADDAKVVDEICRAAERLQATVRLDANRAWAIDEAVEFVRRLKHPGCIEYIEEPTRDVARLGEFFQRTGMGFALDESLDDDEDDADDAERARWQTWRTEHGLRAYVLKPSLLGGAARTVQLLRGADPAALCVVSAMFESGLALAYTTLLAALLDGRRSTLAGHAVVVAHGLGTFEQLAGDLVSPPFASLVRQGSVSIQECVTHLEQWNSSAYVDHLFC